MKQRQYSHALLLFFALFFWALTLRLVAPTVTLKDSGELITSAATLGIAHPPGYPLYSLLGKLFASLPLGEIAFRLNLFSAFMGVLSLVLGVRLITRLGGRASGALVVMGLAGSSLIYLDTFLISEVYTFEVFLLLLALYWLAHPDRMRLSLLAISLLAAQHPKNLIYCLPFFLCWLCTYRRVGVKRFILTTLVGVIPLMVYLYLPLRAISRPALNWNAPQNISRTLMHLSGREYQGRILKPGMRQVMLFRQNILPTFSRSFSWPVLCLGLGGLVGLIYFRAYRHSFLLLIPLVFNLVFGLTALDPVEGFLAHFYLPAILMVAVLAGLGVRYVPAMLFWQTGNDKLRHLAKLLVVLVLLGAFWLRPLGLRERRQDFIAYDFAANQLKCLLPDAVLVAVGTRMTFPLKYLLSAQNQRSDVLLIEGGFLKPIYAGWYPQTLPLSAGVLSPQLNSAQAHLELVNHFAATRSLYFAPLYASGYSPLKASALPDRSRLFNYQLGVWLLPEKRINSAAGFLKRVGSTGFRLRSYLSPQYLPTPYEGYVFRKYNQFLAVFK